jgi:hypothetical protein
VAITWFRATGRSVCQQALTSLLPFSGIQVAANPIMSLAWHYSRRQDAGPGVPDTPFSRKSRTT